MQSLTEPAAKTFTLSHLAKLPPLYSKVNVIHAMGLITAAADLAVAMRVETNMTRIRSLAWLPDTGIAVSDEGNAAHNLALATKEFALSYTDRDHIVNHGSSATPIIQDRKFFRCADGLSLFYPQCALYRLWGDGKEGVSFEKAFAEMTGLFEKYQQAYAANPVAVELMKRRYANLFAGF